MTRWKAWTVLLLVLLFCQSVSAIAILNKSFMVDLSQDQPAITQQYDIRFNDFNDRLAFEDAQSVNTLDGWRIYSDQITPQFGQLRNVSNATFSFDSATNRLEMRYVLDNALTQKIQEDPRNELWVVNTALFQQFQDGATIEIPRNTSIQLTLPYNAEVLPIQNPQVSVNRNIVQLNPLITSNLQIQYRISKPIAPTFNMEFFQDLLRQSFWQAVVGAGLVLLVLGYWQRKKILQRVEDYIVNHSEFSSNTKDDE